MEHKETSNDPLWARLLFMLGYWLLGSIAFSIAGLLGLAQLIVLWVRGGRHGGLQASGNLFADYAYECLEYIIFAKDDKPFPLGSFSKRSDR
ncbi:MAG: DUF4389 domain-containing protein [Hyphomicrobiales bacterium]|nr:DUF4389 domain-containing protein [Hyphomicrobiales bacterium]MCY4032567.1 DUF4389 domain-containing protein [Hyphomicrobiales bacterium]MCY4037970.1 DUF4389 domain-containing protein [Hyphomicrobiales bacterium]